VYLDGANEGYNDPTPVAARAWQSRHDARRTAPHRRAVRGRPLGLGAAERSPGLRRRAVQSARRQRARFRGASFIFRNEPEFPVQDTWYSSALADALTGRDLNPGFTDIGSQFSHDFTFYYGSDGNTPAGTDQLPRHRDARVRPRPRLPEFEDEASGAWQSNTPDIYSTFTFDNTAASSGRR
jgi:hypothetical protein